MVSYERVSELFRRLRRGGLEPEPEPYTAVREVDWERLPPTVDSRTLLSGHRLRRKRDQVANLLALAGPLRPGTVVVDFGAGSGHLSLPLAYLHPDITVWLVDLNEYGLGLARQRAEAAGLTNVRFFAGPVSEFEEPFDVGFALHACGEASDEAQERCLASGATYVICPCDLGKLRLTIAAQVADDSARPPRTGIRGSQAKGDGVTFPRSTRFRKLLSRSEYGLLASAADWTNSDDPHRRARGAQAMAYVNLDRNLAAEEVGYRTLLLVGYPLRATPKNQIIYGVPPERVAPADP